MAYSESMYKAGFNYLKADILYTQNKMINDERIKGSSCKCKDLVKFYAALQLAKIIKIYTDRITETIDSVNEGEGDWKGLYNYEKVKKCLACSGINFDAILDIFEVDSIIS